MKTKNLITKKIIIWATMVVFVFSVFLSLKTIGVSQNNQYVSLTVAIDAGHGGMDGGSVGQKTGKDENYLNLMYALCLQNVLEKYGIKVVMTRTNLNGLYSPFAENKKLDDMAKRKQIILSSNADVLIGIHMNSFPLSSCKGAQVFFKYGDTKSQKLANSIQNVFIKTLPDARQSSSIGDYYMLNEFDIPSVIVECGYLSNETEEALLVTDEYKELVCGSIFVGILSFLSK